MFYLIYDAFRHFNGESVTHRGDTSKGGYNGPNHSYVCITRVITPQRGGTSVLVINY